jgi:hypothetical protein
MCLIEEFHLFFAASAVRMAGAGRAAKGAVDLLSARVFCNAKNLVVVLV